MTLRRFAEQADIMRTYRRVHFIGVGGTGMCGIAEVLHTLGYDVSGSDFGDTATTRRLSELGVRVCRGHHEDHLGDADVVVTSTAIKADNPELMAARMRRVPVVPRAEMLGELMRFRNGIAIAGTHGKTTTTSLVASVLAEGGLDPTFVIGGLLNSAGTNARLGQGKYLVAEADESDGSFLLLNPMLAVITNIDADHLENYGGDFDRLRKAFSDFLHRLPFYGLAVLCIDDPEVRALALATPRNVMTYGESGDADVRAANIRQQAAEMEFDLWLPKADEPFPVRLNLPGRHNVQNALAAAAIGWQLGVAPQHIARALARFGGVGRRFHRHGDVMFSQGKVLWVDDYGHHPRELAAIIKAARGGWPDRRLVMCFQPHRFTRTRDLLDDFADVLSTVDVLVLTEVYAAGESPIAGADGKSLARAVRARGRVDPVLVRSVDELPETLDPLFRDGDLALLAGAGNIGALAARIGAAGRLIGVEA
ncbi:UDP-N-acetylmuramate--L-alanine ligase [Ahniella affigens]|uniref:UDP-N-acetylmuramate--L-alanine ligase n=1 Tax=Ahniella affigens TaxID=2021234 RepID=A0A2P1PM47_9GAMM|nr:UDP-N-acetylmuramate--L-alanine ligase [Ahniella affigens]AVP95918.1 UDP-N-acetylmuramate--L-alanine ligase [Ahniella affigens]